MFNSEVRQLLESFFLKNLPSESLRIALNLLRLAVGRRLRALLREAGPGFASAFVFRVAFALGNPASFQSLGHVRVANFLANWLGLSCCRAHR